MASQFRRHKGVDGWGRDSYDIPRHAVAGSSDCGRCSDSPAPTDKVLAELERVIEYLKAEGVRADFWRPHQDCIGATASGNIFMGKRWVVVPQEQYRKGKRLALKWMQEHQRDTTWIHDAA
jgi:hypothetical protein